MTAYSGPDKRKKNKDRRGTDEDRRNEDRVAEDMEPRRNPERSDRRKPDA